VRNYLTESALKAAGKEKYLFLLLFVYVGSCKNLSPYSFVRWHPERSSISILLSALAEGLKRYFLYRCFVQKERAVENEFHFSLPFCYAII
jgi:hypothetical protein